MKSKALLLVVVASQLTCHQVLFTAPPGTDVACVANPIAISAFGGVSVISCVLTESIGTPVADGTVVQFFTDLGTIPEQGRTNDGVVRVNLQANGRSGTANVSVLSGGGALPATTTTTTAPVQRSAVSSSSVTTSATASALLNSTSVTVEIGNLNADQVIVVAFPPRLTDSRTSQITANVFDGLGNPAPGVPVFFSVTEANVIGPTPTPTGTPTPGATPTPPGNQPTFEHMDSQGRPVYTDSNGQARDVLRTRYPRESPQRSVTVVARVPVGSVEGEVTVFIN